MGSKTETLEKIISTQSYLGSTVKTWINEITCENDVRIPNFLKVGDAIRVNVNSKSNKPRPSIIVKILKESVISIPLTSADDLNTLCPSVGSRFFKDCNFCNTWVITPKDKALGQYLGVYESPASLKNAVKELKIFINKNI